MTREAIASTQYGDLKGTIAFDGYGSGFLPELGRLAGIPKGYFPVGLELHVAEPASNSTGQLSATVFAVDPASVGAGADAVKVCAERNGKVPVRGFPITLSFGDLIPLIKRCSIVVSDRLLGGAPMIVIDSR